MTDRISVTFLLPSLSGGGAERAALNIVTHLNRERFDPKLVLLIPKTDYEVPQWLPVESLNRRDVKRALFAVIQYLRKDRPDVVVSYLTLMNVVTLLARRVARCEARVIVCEQSTPSLKFKNSRRIDWLMLPLGRKVYPWSDSILAPCTGVGLDLHRAFGIPVTKIAVVPNSVDCQHVFMRSREPVAHVWFQANEPPVVVSAGRLVPEKDYKTLLRAFALVYKRMACNLAILGTGPELDSLQTLAENLGISSHVKFLGFQDNPYKYMAQASAFVLTSRWEGFGNVLVEAMICRTPVISTDCPYGPRDILDHGKYGFLVPVGDHQAVADAILTVLTSDNRTLVEAARRRAEVFSIPNVVSKFEDILERVVHGWK